MNNKEQVLKTREEIFREKAKTYLVCYSVTCPIRNHCLRSILSGYVPKEEKIVTAVNLTNKKVQRQGCPEYRDDQPVRMPVGFINLYHEMPSHLERTIKSHLIDTYSRKRYYEYRNGARVITPDVEQHIRDTFLSSGWKEEPRFDGYVEEYLW